MLALFCAAVELAHSLPLVAAPVADVVVNEVADLKSSAAVFGTVVV